MGPFLVQRAVSTRATPPLNISHEVEGTETYHLGPIPSKAQTKGVATELFLVDLQDKQII